MRRIWHHYHKWEDYQNGMWRTAPKDEHEKLIKKAVRFMSKKSFGAAMEKVVLNWPYACEHNLSNTSANRQAWLGQAACCYKIKVPEYITRQAWAMLTETKREIANGYADKWINIWEKNNKAIQLRLW